MLADPTRKVERRTEAFVDFKHQILNRLVKTVSEKMNVYECTQTEDAYKRIKNNIAKILNSSSLQLPPPQPPPFLLHPRSTPNTIPTIPRDATHLPAFYNAIHFSPMTDVTNVLKTTPAVI